MPKTELPATRQSAEPAPPGALSTPQISRVAIRFGDTFAMEAETRVTPLGLLAIGAMVAAIQLSALAFVRARRAGKIAPPRD